jgi:hypothetical protein
VQDAHLPRAPQQWVDAALLLRQGHHVPLVAEWEVVEIA